MFTPYYDIAEIMHDNGGLCFVDFACSAPYIDINMHPENPKQQLDAIYFSPHKFLGGPGATGILAFKKELYTNKVPDNPGGGTVDWTNPWGEHKYVDDIEAREDGGTPAFLQTIKTALCMQLKEKMGVQNILDREHELHKIVWSKFSELENVHVLAKNFPERLGVYSFYIDDLHFYESPAICSYLDRAHNQSALHPAAPEGQARMWQWVNVASHYVFPITEERLVMPRVVAPLMGRTPDEKLIADALPVVRYHLNVVEARLQEVAFLAGAAYSLADSFMYPVIEATCAAPEGAAMVAEMPALKAWFDALGQRPAMQETAWPDITQMA